ncbi:Intradiol ring-cleavage dioxygenase [Microdochium bolleyi]|uniref:Intradiol ring-cleavage dioxygenase n=1 Tax=Microdochium bolleyi TaxID=196109 RepID=A0A136INI4_9PEZI|nr:Intradiol ring-cleavage dioxygenase [Microdochium bolleyi]
MHFLKLIALAAVLGRTAAHPGHDLTQEIAERRAYLANIARTDLSHCAEKLARRGITRRNVQRRAAAVNNARVKRSLRPRDADAVLAINHNATSLGYTPNTDIGTLFAGNTSCILSPEVTQGPYYVSGEHIRSSIADSQPGIPTILDYQVIDVNTCDPVPNVYLEIWHCNSTGVYSGVVASGNGAGTSDPGNINATHHRGIQRTDADGVAQFETTFPGHYTGRATHVHTMVHAGGKLYCNGTLGTQVSSSHVGQTFFDQALIAAVDSVQPYADNTQQLTENKDDSIFAEEAATGADPLFEYTYLGDGVEDGVFGWISFGYNATAVGSEVTPAAFLYAEGGVANADGGGMGGGGGPGGGGSMSGGPSGVPPSGAMPSGAPAAATSSA